MSSSPIDIVKVFYGTYSLMSAEKAGHFLADDFQLVGLTAEPIGRTAWVEFMNALKRALKDLKIRLAAVTSVEDEVIFTEMGVGTQTATMDLSLFGLPPVEATGMDVHFPSSEWKMTVSEGKISRAELLSPPSPDSGLPGLLKAFGVSLEMLP